MFVRTIQRKISFLQNLLFSKMTKNDVYDYDRARNWGSIEMYGEDMFLLDELFFQVNIKITIGICWLSTCKRNK